MAHLVVRYMFLLLHKQQVTRSRLSRRAGTPLLWYLHGKQKPTCAATGDAHT